MSLNLDRGEHLVNSKLHVMLVSDKERLLEQLLAADTIDLKKLKRCVLACNSLLALRSVSYCC